jgi:hypothetical protein
MEQNKTTGAELEISQAAAAMGRKGGKSKSHKKLDAIAQNLVKANNSMDKQSRIDRAKKAAAARWSKARNPQDNEQ